MLRRGGRCRPAGNGAGRHRVGFRGRGASGNVEQLLGGVDAGDGYPARARRMAWVACPQPRSSAREASVALGGQVGRQLSGHQFLAHGVADLAQPRRHPATAGREGELRVPRHRIERYRAGAGQRTLTAPSSRPIRISIGMIRAHFRDGKTSISRSDSALSWRRPGRYSNGVALADEKYILLTTFRRDGTPVATPVWAVPLDDGKIGFWTSSGSGKAKRLAHTERVTVQALRHDGSGQGREPARSGRPLASSPAPSSTTIHATGRGQVRLHDQVHQDPRARSAGSSSASGSPTATAV